MCETAKLYECKKTTTNSIVVMYVDTYGFTPADVAIHCLCFALFRAQLAHGPHHEYSKLLHVFAYGTYHDYKGKTCSLNTLH